MASVIEGMLQAHAEAEANLAYLALDHALAENGHLSRMHQDHHEIDARLKKVHSTNTCAEARRLLKATLVSSREHFALEERSVFPLMERVLEAETLERLGKRWLQQQGEGTGGA